MPRVLCINEGTSKMLNEFYPMQNSNSNTNTGNWELGKNGRINAKQGE